MIHRCIANKELFLRYVNNMPCDGVSWRKTWQPNLEKSSARILMYNLSSMAHRITKSRTEMINKGMKLYALLTLLSYFLQLL